MECREQLVNTGFGSVRFTFGPENLHDPLKPIRLKFNTNRPMVTRVFPRFKRSFLYFEYPLTPRKIFLSLIGCCYYHGFRFTTLTQKGSKFPKKLNFLPAALVLT